MAMRFEFATATRIVFGPGTVGELGAFAAALAGSESSPHPRVLVVTGRSLPATQPVLDLLSGKGIACEVFEIQREPTVADVKAGTEVARNQRCALVVGFGGGSAIDAGKAIAALVTNDGDPLDYLEVIGRNRPLARPPLPYIAIPTTSGTGAEVTRNAVLASPEHQVKVSLRSPLMLPRLAVVDPELTYDLPPAATASTGLDALTQLIEAYTSLRANPMTDGICREGIERAGRSLLRVFGDGHDQEARSDMAIASLFGGLALANAGLGAAHGFAGPIGGQFSAPHGAVCAVLLPHVMRVNAQACRLRSFDHRALVRYGDIARLVTGNPSATAEEGIAWIRRLVEQLQIPPLRAYGMTSDHLLGLVEKGRAASSMKGNPISLTTEELYEVLSSAL